MELKASWWVSQESPSTLQSPKIHYRIHNTQLPVPIRSQIKPVHNLKSYFFKITFNIILYLFLGLPSGFLPSSFPTRAFNYTLSLVCNVPCLSHCPWFDYSDNIRGEHKLSSTLFSLFRNPVTAFLSDSNISLSILFSYNPSLCPFINETDQDSRP